MVTAPLLTKLYVPPPRHNAVTCPRLIDRLNTGLRQGHRLTLLSAPAGFGKTMLVSDSLASRSYELRAKSSELVQIEDTQNSKPWPELERRLKTQNSQVAWLALDEADNAPAQLVAERSGDQMVARDQVAEALRLAAPESYIRAFLDEDMRVCALLREVRHKAPQFVDQVLAHAGAAEPRAQAKGPFLGFIKQLFHPAEGCHSERSLPPPNPVACRL